MDDRLSLPPDLSHLDTLSQSLCALGVDLLIVGETGSGKDTLAQHVHRLSGRPGSFIAMNCAAIPESLCESELFGVVSGAYTGAETSRMGYIEAAQRGTLYLNELDSMPLMLQAKLLRVLEARAVERLGSTTQIDLDICVVASSQRPLAELVEQGVFRRDLYFRLNVLTINLPPLRTQPNRILPLFTQFVDEISREERVETIELDPSTAQALLAHAWPGNIRELKSAARRYVFGLSLFDNEALDEEACGLRVQLLLIERVLIQESLKRNNNNIEAVSRELCLPRRTLYHRMKELGCQSP